MKTEIIIETIAVDDATDIGMFTKREYYWQTGKPTEKGWYVCEMAIGDKYALAEYDCGFYFVSPIVNDKVVRWHKIQEE